LVRNYQSDLEEFGEVRFEIRLNPQGSPTEYALTLDVAILKLSGLLLIFARKKFVTFTFKMVKGKTTWISFQGNLRVSKSI